MTEIKENNQQSYTDYIDVRQLVSIALSNFKLLTYVGLVSGFLSVIYALSLPNIYTSNSVLKINNQAENQASNINSLSGFARSLGVNLSQADDRASYAIETIKSKDFFENLYSDEQFLIELVALEEFSSKEDRVIIDRDIFDKGSWIEKGDTVTGTTKPSLLEAHGKFLSNHFSISRNSETGFIYMSMQHISPNIAQEWSMKVIRLLNSYVMKNESGETTKSIDFLQKQLSEMTNPDVKRTISQVLQQQLQLLMISEVTDEYILKIIDSPFLPEVKTEPSRSRICITFTLLSLLLVYIGLVIKQLNRERRFL